MPLTSLNPATGETVWTGQPGDAAAAVAAARRAQPAWAARPAAERRAILERFAELAKERKPELADLILAEAGKVRPDADAEAGAVAGKVKLTIDALAQRRPDERHDLGNGVVGRVTYKPIGVLAVLGPFNFPMHLPNGHIVPALLTGNAVVFKPSEQTPACGELLIDLFHEAGVPRDVLHIVQGGREVGEALVEADHDGVLFTGGAAAGEAIARRLPYDKMLALELGGNNALVAHGPLPDDAVDLIVQSAFVSAGQRCTCARRLIVTDAVPGDFIDKLAEAVRNVRVDLPDAEPPPLVGPLISEAAAMAVLDAQERLVARGATPVAATQRVAVGLRPIGSQLPCTFLSPGVIDVTGVDVPDAEVFGPLLQLTRVPDLDAAIAEANATRYGLAAGLIGGTRHDFDRFLSTVDAGCVNWNRPLTGASGLLPFGGHKASGNHRPSGSHAVDYCTRAVATLEPLMVG